MTTPALVSVAIPAYNHAHFIEACLASVCAQTYSELELVLIDDGSSDDTFARAQAYLAPRRERFRRLVVERRANQGVSANSNACIAACQGQWVHLLGSDDLLYPNKVERIQQAIGEWDCAGLALVHADCDYIGADGGTVTRNRMKSRPPEGPDREAWRWLFAGEHYIFNPTLALNRELFLAAGGFDPKLPLEDLDCWLRLSVSHPLARVPEVLASYRKHPGNASRRRLTMLAALFKTYAKFLDANPGRIPDGALREHFRSNVWRFWRRLRKKKPWLLPRVAASLLKSRWQAPQAVDYEALARLLDEAARERTAP
jgi:alpha-1,3-rhamnosyltransferase